MRRKRNYWVTRAFYGKRVRWPKVQGALAIETWQSSLGVHQTEMAVFRSRADIGSVRITDYRTDPPTITTVEVE